MKASALFKISQTHTLEHYFDEVAKRKGKIAERKKKSLHRSCLSDPVVSMFLWSVMRFPWEHDKELKLESLNPACILLDGCCLLDVIDDDALIIIESVHCGIKESQICALTSYSTRE